MSLFSSYRIHKLGCPHHSHSRVTTIPHPKLRLKCVGLEKTPLCIFKTHVMPNKMGFTVTKQYTSENIKNSRGEGNKTNYASNRELILENLSVITSWTSTVVDAFPTNTPPKIHLSFPKSSECNFLGDCYLNSRNVWRARCLSGSLWCHVFSCWTCIRRSLMCHARRLQMCTGAICWWEKLRDTNKINQ